MSFTAVRKELAEQTEHDGRLSCRWCKKLTLRETLSQYGRCFECFEAYCNEPQAKLRGLPAGPGHDPKAWAWNLKEREESGERLTSMQKEMWRSGLKPERDAA